MASTKNGTAAKKSAKTTDQECNILLTCAGRRVALLDAFRDAARLLGVSCKIIATDITSASPAFHKADTGEITPPAGVIEYVPRLLEIVQKHNIRLLVPMTDLDLRSLGRQRQKFAEAGCTVMVGSEDTVILCRDKARLNSVLERAGLHTIRTFSLQEFLVQPFYPCFVKPIRGSASVGTAIINSDRELHAHIATFGDLMVVQEYVGGAEYTIDVYRSRDGQVRSIVPRQRLAVRSGEVEKGITVKNPALIEAAGKLAVLLGDLWGVFCCQCKFDEKKGPRFFEVNPRFGGGTPLSIAAGANMPLYLMQEVLGLPITAQLGAFTDHLLMLRYDQAVFVPVEDPASLPGRQTPTFR